MKIFSIIPAVLAGIAMIVGGTASDPVVRDSLKLTAICCWLGAIYFLLLVWSDKED